MANLTAKWPIPPIPTTHILIYLFNFFFNSSNSFETTLNAVNPAQNKGEARYKGILFGIGKAQSDLTWTCVLNPPISGNIVQEF